MTHFWRWLTGRTDYSRVKWNTREQRGPIHFDGKRTLAELLRSLR
jgi:hypothetical protein